MEEEEGGVNGSAMKWEENSQVWTMDNRAGAELQRIQYILPEFAQSRDGRDTLIHKPFHT